MSASGSSPTPPSPPAAPAPSTPDPEKHRDRVFSVRTAFIAAIGALAASVINLGSAHITGDNEQEQQLRTDRKEVYAQFLTDANSQWGRIDKIPLYDVPSTAQMQAVEEGYTVLDEDYAMLQLVGSDNAAERAHDFIRSMTDMEFRIAREYCSRDGAERDGYCNLTSSWVEGEKRLTVLDAHRAYLDVVRQDLGIE